MARCGGCRRCGWYVQSHRRGRLKGLVVVQHGCVPRGRRRYSSQQAANDAAKRKAKWSGAWVLAGLKEV